MDALTSLLGGYRRSAIGRPHRYPGQIEKRTNRGHRLVSKSNGMKTPLYGILLSLIIKGESLLLVKASNASNVGNIATGPKVADLPFGQKTTVTSPTLVIPSQDLPTTSQQEFSQTSQLSSIEEDVVRVQGIVEKFEVESGRSLSVKGNVRAHIDFWKSIGAPDFILSIIGNGYQIPFTSSPEPAKLKITSLLDSMPILCTKPSVSLYFLAVFGRFLINPL